MKLPCGGEKSLRKLELRLLEAGLTVSRTASDLVTALDIAKSRSFRVVSRNDRLVQEALKLYEADTNRQP